MSESDRISMLNTREDNISHKSLLKHIRETERVHYPPSWVWKSVIGFALMGFSILSLLILGNADQGITQNDLVGVLVCGLSALVFTLFGLYKLSSKAFSIRLNAFGMMVTHYSKQKWYTWNNIHEIYTHLSHTSSNTSLSSIIEIEKSTYINSKNNTSNLQRIVMPENHEISSHALVKEMLYFKQKYVEMNLDKFPELENEAKKDPHQILNIIWGRLGAK